MTDNASAYKMLDDNDPIVQRVLKEAGIPTASNNDKARLAGSRKDVLPNVVETDAALEAKIKEAEEPKTLSITLSARDYALMLREAVRLKKPVEQHLQEVVAEMLIKRLGKATISGATFMGERKITAVTNSVRRGYD